VQVERAPILLHIDNVSSAEQTSKQKAEGQRTSLQL
jgi:hypothetical protein